MSHNVEKMVFTGKSPWWYGNRSQGTAIGTYLGDDAITSEQAMIAADLDWKVDKVTAGYRSLVPRVINLVDGQQVEDGLVSKWTEVEGEKFLVRTKDGQRNVLGRCTDGYQEFQNTEGFAFLDGLVDEGNLLYHTAGSLEGGKFVWILAQTPISWTIKRLSGKEDKHYSFLNCLLGHDGKSSISLIPTNVNVVCANTQGYADSIAERENLIFRIPHRGDIKAKLDLAATAIETLSDRAEGERAILQGFAQQAMNTDEFIDFATSIFLGIDGSKEETEELVSKFYEDATPRSKTILENKVAAVALNFEHGQGNEGASSYDALQAFTEYFDHFNLDHIKDKIEQGKRAAKAVQSSWIGAGAERKSLVYKRLNERLH